MVASHKQFFWYLATGVAKVQENNMGDIDINTLIMEQYMAFIRDNNRSGVVKPEIRNDVDYEIKNQFMKELRRNLFAGTKDEDAHEYVRKEGSNDSSDVIGVVTNKLDCLEYDMLKFKENIHTIPVKFGKLLEEIHVTWTQNGKTRQDYNFTRSGFKNAGIVPGDGVTISSDVVRTYKRRRQKLCDDVRT
ncbi:hypothetical protein Tco_1253381 [Tanacetum coccineum]